MQENDAPNVSGGSRLFSEWTKELQSHPETDKTAPCGNHITRKWRERILVPFDWQVTIMALEAEGKHRATDGLIVVSIGIRQRGEHELSNQSPRDGHQKDWKGGCCPRGGRDSVSCEVLIMWAQALAVSSKTCLQSSPDSHLSLGWACTLCAFNLDNQQLGLYFLGGLVV